MESSKATAFKYDKGVVLFPAALLSLELSLNVPRKALEHGTCLGL